MNLGQIRQRVNDRLNQITGGYFPEEYLNRTIDDAYQGISSEMQCLGLVQIQPGNITGHYDVSVASPAREYPIPMQVSRIVDVTRVESGGESQVELHPFSMRDTSLPGWGDDCYVYQAASYLWYIGTIDPTPRTQTLRVYYTTIVVSLTNDHDVPVYLPHAHHGLIAVAAAIQVLQDQNREIGTLGAIYAGKLDRMKRHMRSAVTPGRVRKLTLS